VAWNNYLSSVFCWRRTKLIPARRFIKAERGCRTPVLSSTGNKGFLYAIDRRIILKWHIFEVCCTRLSVARLHTISWLGGSSVMNWEGFGTIKSSGSINHVSWLKIERARMILNHLTRLIAREDFTNFSRLESFRSYDIEGSDHRLIEVLSHHLAGGTEEYHEIHKSG
jgi:hypothetical protein